MEYCKSEIIRLKEFAGVVESSMARMPRRHEFELSERSGGTMESLVTAEDVSLYHTCRANNWADVIGMGASGSHRGSLGASMASHQLYWGEL